MVHLHARAQALVHEVTHLDAKTWRRTLVLRTASGLCNFPWSMYYEDYHPRHHAHTGAEDDRDGDVLFSPWYRSPWRIFRESTVGRVAWTAVFAFNIYWVFVAQKFRIGQYVHTITVT